ncbi:MAG: oligosaccharide flippase family protein, partial [Bacteroidales bacterium]|nr:oligosaccharide flippase family protein [Bacteroidales bacterium]
MIIFGPQAIISPLTIGGFKIFIFAPEKNNGLSIINKVKGDMHFRELFQGGSIAVVFRVTSALASYIFIYFLAHTYGAVGVGIFSTSWTILMIGSVLGKMGFDTSIVRFMAESSSNHSYLRMRSIYKKSLRITLVASLLVALIIIAFSGYFTGWFYETVDTPWMVMLVGASVVPYSLMSFNAESLKGLKKILPFSIHQNVSVYFGALFILWAMNYVYDDARMIIAAIFLALILLMTSSFSTLRFFLKFYPRHDSFYSKPIPKSGTIIGTTLPMMLTNSLFLVLNWTDVLMLATMTDDASVGIYNTALKIAALNSLVLIGINTIAMPKYAELYEKNKER